MRYRKGEILVGRYEGYWGYAAVYNGESKIHYPPRAGYSTRRGAIRAARKLVKRLERRPDVDWEPI